MTSQFPTPDRSPMLQVNIKRLINDVQCYQTVRELRWPDGIMWALSQILVCRRCEVSSPLSVEVLTRPGRRTVRPH